MKTKLISCLFLCVLCCSLQAKTKKSNGSKNTTNVVWNDHCWGFNPGSYNEANFETAFPNGVSIGHGLKMLSFTSYAEIVNFLNSESNANHLSLDKKLNADSYNNLFAKQLIALTLSIGFDFYDNPQFSYSKKLANFKIRKGFYKDKTVQQFLKIANGIYGDASQTSSIPNLVSTVKFISRQFSDDNATQISISSLTLLNDVKCFEGNNGREKVTINGGVSPFTFTLSNGNVLISAANSVTFSNLSAGNYTVIVTDNLGNTATGSNTFTISEPSMLMTTTSATDVSCYGLSNGTATVIPSGGTAPYTILWNNGSTSLTLTNLAAGTYTAMLMDANLCCKPITVYVDVPEMLMASASSTNISCYGGFNGSVTATVSGGSPAYSILWSNGNTNFSQSGLSAGTYTAVITDANGCSENVSTTISEPSMLVVASSSTNVLCYGDSSGTATASASGGTAPYTILWSNGSTSFTLTGLNSGTNTAIISDANLCCKPISVTIEQPEALMAMVDSTNVLCYSGNTGTATASAMGGTSPYTILWNNGSVDFNLTGLSAGTFTAVITDANGCNENVSTTISEPSLLVAAATSTNVLCYGDSIGTATATASGGTAPYTILWSNGSTSFSQTGLSAGTYTAIISDANLCCKPISVTIEQPEALMAMVDSTNILCYGGNTATATASAMGGTSPYTILWNNGSANFNLTGLLAGTYTAVITDANGCSENVSLTITQPEMLMASASSTNVTCYGFSNGTASVTATGGTASISILWSNGSTSFDLTSLSSGTYTAVVTDANGCTQNISVDVTQPDAISVGTQSSSPTCFGGYTGTITTSPYGGTAPYTILWSNGSTDFNLTGLNAATYTAVVTDANGCTYNLTFELTQPTELSLFLTSTDVTCYGGNNGSANVSVSNGTAPYTILWNNGSTSFTNTGLIAGTHTAVVTDANGCYINVIVEVAQPTELTTENDQYNPTCCMGNSGTATVTASGGTAPYTILWSNGSTSFSLAGLSSGTLTYVVTDANGCTASGSVTIVASPLLTVSATSINALCHGGLTGSATATVTGGTAPHTILWSNGSTSFTNSGLAAGTHNAIITDANGCIANVSVVITEPYELVSSFTSTNPSCCSGENGTATVTSSGGTPTHSILWNNGATTFNMTGLAAGTYTYVVTDANSCTTAGSVTIVTPAAMTASVTGVNVMCYGGLTGSATATVTGGTALHTILWSNGSTSFTNSGLAAGTHNAIITDANGCIANVSVVITEPYELVSSFTSTNPSCCSGENGTATVTSSGGTPAHSILWNNGATTFNMTGLAAGTYTYVVTDANSCTTAGSVTIVTPAAMTASVTGVNVMCYGGLTGSATAWATGGTAPHTILWSNGSTSFTNSGLAAGTHNAIITDANGCIANVSVVIEEPFKLDINVSHTNSDCSGENGTATVTSSGGTAPHSYLWSTGATTATISGLLAGTYSVLLTDSNGCTETASITITASAAMSVYVANTNVNCHGSSNGSASVTASGGTAPLTILWSNGSTSFNPTGLSAGTHTAIITDYNGCKINVSVTITEPEELVSSYTQINPSCCSGNNASITVVSSGGTPTHSILWNNGNTNFTRTGLSVGTYTYTVADYNGCTTSGSVTILNVAPMSILITKTNIMVYGGYGTATANVTGGTAAYTYKWYSSPFQYTQTASLQAGTWKVKVTDANGCISYKWVTLSQGTCSGYVTIPNGIYGQSCTDGGWSCYLTDNFTTSFPSGLFVGSGNNLLNFTNANSVSGFLPSGNFFGPLSSGTMVNPTSTYNNGLAGQAITLTLTLAFNNNLDFSAPTSPMGELFVSSGIFTGMTVNQLLDIANRILGGESSNYAASEVYDALNRINNNYENGQIDLGYLVLTNPSLATNNVDLNNQILSYVVYPNPVKNVSKIEFSLTFDTSINIQVYDLNGRLISTLFKGKASSGQKYDVEFNSNDLAAGTYFIKLVTDKNVYNKSVLVSK